MDRYRFTLSGFVQSAFDPEVLTVNFGTVARDDGAAVEVEVASREVRELNVEPGDDLPGAVGVRDLGSSGPAGQGRRLRVTLAPGAAQGILAGVFHLETNVAHQARVPVFYRAKVIGDVVPAENPLQMGITRLGQSLRKEVDLSSASGRPVEVQRVVDTGGVLEWEVEACSDASDESCRRVVLTMTPEAPQSLIGKLLVYVAGASDPITLNYRGMIVGQDTVIKTIPTSER